MFFLPISRSWMYSAAAQRIYLLSAALNFALLATIVGVTAAMFVSRVFVLPPLTANLVGMMLLPESMGVAVLLVGMSYFWLGFDTSGYLNRAWWLVLVYFLGPFALPFYYLLVYRRLVSVGSSAVPVPSPLAI